MAKLLKVSFPHKFEASLRQLGRLDPSGRLILDESGELKNVREPRELSEKVGEGENCWTHERSFQEADFGYLGKFYIVDQWLLVPEKQGLREIRRIEEANRQNVSRANARQQDEVSVTH